MQHVPFRTAATQSGSFCGTVVTRELGKKNENMRVNLCGALIGIKFVMESFLCFALTPNPKEYSSHVLENHKNQVHNTLCDLSELSHERTGKKNYYIASVYRTFSYPYPYPTFMGKYKVNLD